MVVFLLWLWLLVVGGADAVEEALLHLDRGLEFYQLNVNSKVGILTGLVQILKKGRTFRSWVQDNVRNGMVQKKKVNAIILKSRKERAAIKNKEKEDRKRDREREKRKKVRDALKDTLDNMTKEERDK